MPLSTTHQQTVLVSVVPEEKGTWKLHIAVPRSDLVLTLPISNDGSRTYLAVQRSFIYGKYIKNIYQIMDTVVHGVSFLDLESGDCIFKASFKFMTLFFFFFKVENTAMTKCPSPCVVEVTGGKCLLTGVQFKCFTFHRHQYLRLD